MTDLNRRRQLGRDMVARISKLLAGKLPGIDQDLRFSYLDNSFRLWWGERGDPDTTLIVTFEQIRSLDDEELRHLIRSAVESR